MSETQEIVGAQSRMHMITWMCGKVTELTAKLVTKPCRGYKPWPRTRVDTVPSRLLRACREFQGQCSLQWARKAQNCRLEAFFHEGWRKEYEACTPRLFSLCRWHVSLSHFCPASGPAAPDHGQSFTCTLPPKCLLCLSTLSLPLHDCPSSGPLNQFFCFLSHPDKPRSAALPMQSYK